MLKDKTIHQLRSIAQGFDIPDIFSKDHAQLVQAIEMKRDKMIPEPVISPPLPQYDARMMTEDPSAIVSKEELDRMLEPYRAKGLHVSYPDPESFQMEFGKKTDTGTLRQPLRNILLCAEKILK